MRSSPLTVSIVYFCIGVLLVVFAIQNVNHAGWDVWTFILIAFATFDIGVSFRYFQLNLYLKKMKRQREQQK